MAVANIDDPAALAHLIAGALRISTEEKQELLEEVDVVGRLRHLSQILARELEVVQLGTQIQSQVAVGDRQRPARVLPAPAAESDPGRAGRGRRAAGGSQRTARADRGGEAARARPQSRRPRALAAGETAAGRGRARRHPHLPGVAGRAALVDGDRGQPRHRPRPRGPRRRPLRPREGQGPHPRVPGGAQAEPGLAGADPLLRRPARRRQDQPRPLDRQSAGARVRADLGRRRPRRGGDPRPPPHLHRRHAGDDHPRPPRRRLAQSRLHDRRDRQDGRRLPRRPGLGDARGPRPGPERLLPRPLPRPRVRPLRGHVHRHGEHARHDSRPAAGPDGDDRAGRLHAGGEEAHRPPLPGPAPDRGERPEALADRVRRPGAGGDHRGVHARGRGAEPRAPDRHDLPQSRPRSRRGQGQRQGEDLGQAGPRAARPPPRLRRAAAPHQGSRASPPAWPGRRPAATSSSSRRPRCRAPAS